MRSKFLTAGVLIVLAGPAVAADCSGPFLTPTEVQSDLGGKYLYDVAGSPTYDELHHINGVSDTSGGSGSVDEYKKGPTDPVDPTVNNYATISITVDSTVNKGAAVLTYQYTSGYTTPGLEVMDAENGTYEFCNAGALYTTSIASSSHG
jgi:hypothetical protein